MGGISSMIYGASSDSSTDPKSGLTGRQKKLVQSTWMVVRKDPIANGVAVMIALFTKHPEYQQLFNGFKHLPLAELPPNKKFQAHCLSIINALNGVVDSMNDPTLLGTNLLSIGEKHQRRGQTREQFYNLKEVMMEVLAQKFGPKFTPEVTEAWSKTLDVVIEGIFDSVLDT